MKAIVTTLAIAILAVGCATTAPHQEFAEILQRAGQGDPAAQAEAGHCYQYGDGVTKDPTKAYAWNLKAANQGNAMAQHNLAVMLDEGIDIPEDNATAVEWYRKSAEQGHPAAQLNLAIMYWRGEGVKQDLEQAWNLLNTVRMSSPNKQAQWQARAALDEIKKELGVTTDSFSYPEWNVLQQSR